MSTVNTQVLRADLTGDDFASIGDIAARSSTPVLTLCPSLLVAGVDPDGALEVIDAALAGVA
jgi:hypothetical protein